MTISLGTLRVYNILTAKQRLSYAYCSIQLCVAFQRAYNSLEQRMTEMLK